MAHEESALRTTIEIGASSVALAGAAVLLLALVAELVRRRRAGARVVALADRLLPTTSLRIAVGLLTIASTVTALALPSAAHADDRTRTWLEDAGRPTTRTTADPRAASTTPSSTTPASTSSTTSATTTATTARSTTTEPPPLPTTEGTHALVPSAPAQPVASPAVSAPRAAAVLSGAPTPVDAAAPSPRATDAPTYTVVTGDCLWSIASRRLGGGASGRAIDRGWRAIYAANRDAIGTDPNLVHPGLVLTLPALDPTP